MRREELFPATVTTYIAFFRYMYEWCIAILPCLQIVLCKVFKYLLFYVLSQYQVKRSKQDDTESVASYSLSPVGKKR